MNASIDCQPVSESTLKTILTPTPTGTSDGALLVLIHPKGAKAGFCYRLTHTPVIVGRGQECAISIAHPSVSRHHARIEPSPTGYSVYDLHSTNGTYLNDQPITQSRLADGDYLRVGNCIFRFLHGDNIEAAYHEEIHRLAIYDPLTGIANQRCFLEVLDRELARSARYQRPLSLIVFDVDRFKEINDTMGHLAGDATLRELAARIQRTVRKDELFARWGGDEFVLLLPETPAEEAARVTERLTELVASPLFRFENLEFAVQLSVGVATTDGTEPLEPKELLQSADAEMYRVKRGRQALART